MYFEELKCNLVSCHDKLVYISFVTQSITHFSYSTLDLYNYEKSETLSTLTNRHVPNPKNRAVMPPASNSTIAADSHAVIPYLLAGLAIMMALIATALAILGCSYSKPPANEDEDAAAANRARMQLEMEPKTVVIVPGDELPRYLAKPAAVVAVSSSATFHTD